MPKRLTVFYSWQSDTPSKLNRNFIEKALHEAVQQLRSDAIVEPALRDTVIELDKDTKGVAGSPPIADTILRKIEECSVFVADLTFVGESMGGMINSSGKKRLFPNPNVLIEYGYALKTHSHKAMVGVMNAAYGKPDHETLPFDLRHLRWPLTYDLSPESGAEKQSQLEKLILALKNAISPILAATNVQTEPIPAFTPNLSVGNASQFFDRVDDLIPEDYRKRPMEPFTIPNEGRAYLKLHPQKAVPSFKTAMEAVRYSQIRPFGEVSGWNPSRNKYGAIFYQPPIDGKLYSFSQLFVNKEIWGVDAYCLNASACKAISGRNGEIFATRIERIFIETLESYLHVAKTELQLPLPLAITAGLVGVKGYPIVFESYRGGAALTDHIVWAGEVVSYETTAAEVLEPFFQHLWAECGEIRRKSH